MPEGAARAELPSDHRVYLGDRTIELTDRIERARALASEYGEITVPVAELVTVEGQSVPDKHLSSEQLKKLIAEYGFPPSQYEGTQYDARTVSTKHDDLTLQVAEGPLEVGAATELFPDGKTHSVYDHTVSVNVIVRAK